MVVSPVAIGAAQAAASVQHRLGPEAGL